MTVHSAVQPHFASGSKGSRRWQPDWALIAICALAAIPAIYLALTQFVEYDGFWHVFIAQQDNWHNFWLDYKDNDHPPLFYLLLKAVMQVHRSVFAYRSISIACDLGSIYLIGKTAQKFCSSRLAPLLAALAFGVSIATIEISVSVRSYMLATFFVVLSFYFFLDLLPGGPAERRGRSRVLFALTLLLAVSSHYFTFFYVTACAVVLQCCAAMAWRALPWKTWAANAVAFVPVAWLMRYYYRTHIRLHTVSDDYLTDFSLHGHETKLHFLARNLQSIFNFLSPWRITHRGEFNIVLGALVLFGLAILLFVRSRALVPMVMLTVLTGGLAWAGLHGKYPFGGLLRQQFILFPFLMLTGAVYADRLFALLPSRKAILAVAAVFAVSILSLSVYRFHIFPMIRGQLFDREMNQFNAALPEARAVFLDQFSLIIYFTHQHQWTWHFIGKLAMAEPVDEYTLRLGNRHLTVLRDKSRWNFDFADPAFFHDVAQAMRTAHLESLAVFTVHQVPGSLTAGQQDALEQKASALAHAEHLQIRKFVPDGLNVYAEFARAETTQ